MAMNGSSRNALFAGTRVRDKSDQPIQSNNGPNDINYPPMNYKFAVNRRSLKTDFAAGSGPLKMKL